MRIRTDGDYSHRQRMIDRAAEFYDYNKTQALLNAADDVQALEDALQSVLARDDLTTAQKREIAAQFTTPNLSAVGNLSGPCHKRSAEYRGGIA